MIVRAARELGGLTHGTAAMRKRTQRIEILTRGPKKDPTSIRRSPRKFYPEERADELARSWCM